MAKQRFGIMGGTFDPIHLGHLATAEAVWDELNLTEVLFIPAAHPPHKEGRVVTEAVHRLVMTYMATAANPHFRVLALELYREGPSYSVDTVKELKQRYGDDTEFYFITGADAINELATWHRAAELLKECHFIAATRGGTKLDRAGLSAAFGEIDERIRTLTTPALEISSTAIRERVKAGHSIKYLVPDSVADYICKKGLYL